jgi:hypothetical protein
LSVAPLTRLPAGEQRTVGTPELEAAAGTPPAGVDPDEYFGAWLHHHGLVVRATAREDESEDDAVAVALSPRFALQAAAALGLIVAIVAAAGRPIYGAVTLLLSAAACGGLVLAWPVLSARVPRWLPRGRLLGLVAIVPALIVALAVVVVLRHHYEQGDAQAAAARDVHDANTALDQNNPKLAIFLLSRAEGEDPHAAGIQTTRSRLVIAQSTGRIQALEAEIRRLKAERRSGR